MPGRVRAVKRATDPIRGRGRIPLVKRRSAGHPEFRPAGVPTVSVLEAKIADAVLGAMQSIPHQTFLDSVERGDADGYAATVLNRLSEASAAIEEALMEAFIVSGETSALEVGKDLAREYSKFGKAADVPLPSEVALQFRFDRTDPRATAWVRNEAGQLITNMTNESRLLIRNVIGDAFESQRTWAQTGRGIFAQLATITPSPSVRDYADVLGANLNGLTTRYERAVVNRVTALADDYAARGITGTKALQGMRKEGDRYAERLRRSRSRTIARTERMRAHNEARLLSYQQAIESGLASSEHSRKEWQTGPFDVCPICVSTAGQKVKVNEGFTLPNGQQVMAPPAHPNCRCSMTMLTDTRLYEPSDRLGTGLPGDPFRTTPRGFTDTGQTLSQRPLPGVPTAPEPVSRLAVEGVDEARVLVEESQLGLTEAPFMLDMVGLTNGRRAIPSVAGASNEAAKTVLDLILTQKGNQVVETVLDIGKKARRILDDEIDRLSGGLASERKALLEAQEATKKVMDEQFEIVKSQHAANTRDELERFLDAMPDQSQHNFLYRFLYRADDIDLEAAFQTEDVVNSIRQVIEANASNGAVVRYFEEVAERLTSLRPTLTPKETLTTLMRDFDKFNDIAPRTIEDITDWMSRLNSVQRYELRQVFDESLEGARNEMFRVTTRILEVDRELKQVRVEALEGVLKANREGFGQGDALSKFNSVRGKAGAVAPREIRDELRNYARRVPAEWLEEFREGYSIAFVKRGHYSHYDKHVRLSGGDWRETLTHEMTHGHQYHSRRIQMFERMYLSRRSTLDEYADTWYVPKTYNQDPEPWFDLGFGEKYATKIYDDGITELSTRAAEQAWYGLDVGVDSEIIEYWLGVLLTL